MLRPSIPFAFSHSEDGAEDDAFPVGHDVFGSLVAIYQSNALLAAELNTIRLRMSRVRDYRESPGANIRLADIQILRLGSRRSAALRLLKANRLKARYLLGRFDGISHCA
jgi:hypothetical protein